MKFTVAAALLAAATGAHAYGKNVTVVTEVVDKYVTYCPEPTEIVHGDKTITVSVPGTITITDCPCTITKPVVEETHEIPSPEKPEVPETTPEVEVPPPTGGVVPPPEETPIVGGAGKAAALSGAGLAGVVGLAAFIL